MNEEYQLAQVSEFVKPEHGIPGYKPTTEVTPQEWNEYIARQKAESEQATILIVLGTVLVTLLFVAWRRGKLERYLNLKRPERRICFAAFLVGTALTTAFFLTYHNPLSSQVFWASAIITGLALIGWLAWEIAVERFLNWIKVGK